nr:MULTISPECIES: alpha-ketoglutarate-dependent dioxygenase AlkB [Rhodomicrobium]
MNEAKIPAGCGYFPGHLGPAEQSELLAVIRAAIAQAPLYTPTMPRTDKPFSVAMTNCGPLGWVSDKAGGYRYEQRHPGTGEPWPPIPPQLLLLWSALTGDSRLPQACLINYYGGKAKLGLHRDEDESDFSAPILSVSLGDSALFRIGGLARRDPTTRMILASGDVLVMGGPSRLRYHGIDRIMPGTSDLLAEGGRFNLTLRYVGAGPQAA